MMLPAHALATDDLAATQPPQILQEETVGSITPLSEPIEQPPFDVDAPSVLLVEEGSGRVIFEKNADEKRPVASVTKLMTLLLVFEAIDEGRLRLDDTVTVSRNAASTSGSEALLDGDSDYVAGELIKSVIIASANDAAVALAEHLYGSETAFVRRMNGRAAELGLADTVYQNCTGLAAENQYTTARDVAQLSRKVAQHDLLYDYSGIWMDEIIHPKNSRRTDLTNTNRLIRTYEGADGLKTGSTSEAKFCVSASAVRDDMRLIAVVLGAPSSSERFATATKMLDYGFDHYYLYKVADQGQVVREALPVKGSGVREVDIVAGAAIQGMIMKGEENDVTFELILPEYVQAPLAAGEKVGEVIISKDGEVIAKVPAVVEQDVDNAGFIGSILRVLNFWMG
jgi:D-alanyl-D-alanine carboxypeptidase (penicillin-binding protein 5/6)